MTRITIIGAGFAGLSAVREIRKRDTQVDITLVAPRAELHYLPGIIWIPSGLRQREDLVVPLDNFFGACAWSFAAPRSPVWREGGRIVETSDGRRRQRRLVDRLRRALHQEAAGHRARDHALRRHRRRRDDARPAASRCSGGTMAVGFAGNPNDPSAMRGGPMFEFLFGIDQQLRREGRRDRFELTFFSPAAEPGNRLGPKAVGGLLGEMARRDIRTHLGHKLKRFEAGQGGHRGRRIQGRPDPVHARHDRQCVVRRTDLPRSPGGLLKADAHCRVDGRASASTWPATRAASRGRTGCRSRRTWPTCRPPPPPPTCWPSCAETLTTATFKVELICIVDANDRGMLVVRTPQRNFVLPNSRAFHWAKRGFEALYLRRYR